MTAPFSLTYCIIRNAWSVQHSFELWYIGNNVLLLFHLLCDAQIWWEPVVVVVVSFVRAGWLMYVFSSTCSKWLVTAIHYSADGSSSGILSLSIKMCWTTNKLIWGSALFETFVIFIYLSSVPSGFKLGRGTRRRSPFRHVWNSTFCPMFSSFVITYFILFSVHCWM